MKARPILFSGPMVRALLDGRKTQTRRVVKPQPTVDQGWEEAPGWALDWKDFEDGFTPKELAQHCPYGQPGDLLWVRESFASIAPNLVALRAACEVDDYPGATWKPSIHMPRWASRLTLEITGVRVERLLEISDVDALAEGVDRTNTSIHGYAKERYRRLWDTINGAGSWDANSWVWVLDFRVHQKNVDAFLKEREPAVTEEDESLPCRDCDGSGEVFVKRDRQGRVDYLSGRVINNETARCDRCKGEGIEP